MATDVIVQDLAAPNAVSGKVEIEALFLPERPRALTQETGIPFTISGVTLMNPAAPLTMGSSTEDLLDILRMRISEFEAMAGEKRAVSEYFSERAARKRAPKGAAGGREVHRRGHQKRGG